MLISVVQCEQEKQDKYVLCCNSLTSEARLAYGHAALSLIAVVAGDSETHVHVYD